MLIVHRLAPGGQRYYLAAVGPTDPERIDAPRLGEAPGRWWGARAAQLGLSGVVEPPALREQLPRGPHRIPAFDLTFAAPKSVSVLHGLGDRSVATVVRDAHDRAVEAGLTYVERHACAVRSGGAVVRAPGLCVAAFRHRVSRAEDPHLHTHALVLNVASGPSGHSLALHSPLLYAERRAAAAAYHAELRHQLTTRLGVSWRAPEGGRADVEQVPPGVRFLFSRRRAAVLAESAGDPGPRRWAERVTRPDSGGLLDADHLAERWQAQAKAVGWELPELGPRRRIARPGVTRAVAAAIPDRDRWTRADVTVALVDRLRDGAPFEELEAACDRILTAPGVIPLGGRERSRHASECFTTGSALARRLRVTTALRGAGGAIGTNPEALDGFRRRQVTAGHRLLLVTHEATAAAGLADRVGAPAVTGGAATPTLAALEMGTGDAVVVVRPERFDSRELDCLLAAAASRDIRVVAASSPPDGRDADVPPPTPVVTVPTVEGDLTAAGSARGAAEAAIADVVRARREGRAAVVVAGSDEVGGLSARVRRSLRAAGLLGRMEVGGLATGDVVRFGAARPSVGVSRHETADVVAVDPVGDRVTLALSDFRRLELRVSELGTVLPAHVVPPLPQLVAGRGEVHVVGGWSARPRHVGPGRVHRYVTVAGGGVAVAVPALRHQTLDHLDQAASTLARRTRLPPDTTGDRRRLADRRTAAAEWMTEAEERRRLATAGGDRDAAAAWSAQCLAARHELAELRVADCELDRRDAHRILAAVSTGPERRMLREVQAHAGLRVAALDRAAALGLVMDHSREVERARDRDHRRARSVAERGLAP